MINQRGLAIRPAVGPFDPLGAGRLMRFASDEHIFHEGDPLDATYELTDGVALLYKTGVEGSRHLLGIRFAGDLLGTPGRCDHDCSAVVTRAARVRRWPREYLEVRMQRDSDLAKRLLRACQDELLRTREQLLVVGSRSAVGRVAALLELIAKRTDGPVFALPLSRQDMADYLGLTIETVSRSMTRLRSLGVIALARADQVTIIDKAQLATLAAGLDEGAARGRLIR